LHEVDAVLSGDQLGIGGRQRIGPDIVLLDPTQPRSPQCRHVRPDHWLQSGITGLGDENSADARRDILSAGTCLTGVTKRINEAGPDMNFEHQLREIDTRYPGVDRTAQIKKALWFLQLIERREN
jgi:hypothetical protein